MNAIKYKVRPTWKESANHYQGRPIAIALEPGAVLVRLKRKRAVYRVPIDHVYRIGAMLEARRITMERKAKKKGNRNA